MFVIKKVNVLLILLLVSLILTACETTETKVIIKDEIFLIEDIRFEEQNIFIDTEVETLVYDTFDITFRKTNKNSYINFRDVENRNLMNLDLITFKYPIEKTINIYINENAVKYVSKKYAKEFKETLPFIVDDTNNK